MFFGSRLYWTQFSLTFGSGTMPPLTMPRSPDDNVVYYQKQLGDILCNIGVACTFLWLQADYQFTFSKESRYISAIRSESYCKHNAAYFVIEKSYYFRSHSRSVDLLSCILFTGQKFNYQVDQNKID